MSLIEDEHLITALQLRPEIYNQSHPDYYNKVVRNRIWRDIAKEFGLEGS